MEFEPEDQDVVSLLTRLKNAEDQYPEQMFAARRQTYLRQMANIGMGLSANSGISNPAADAATNLNPPPISPLTSTLLETALVFAIIVETTAVAYFYRDRLADFFQTIAVQSEPRVGVVASPPAPLTALEIQGVTPSPVITSTLPSTSIVISPSPTGTMNLPTVPPLPGVAHENEPNNSNGAGVVTVDSTPVPGGSNNNSPGQGSNAGQTPEPERTSENSGNHYGQTPKPERTRENNGNNSPGN